MPKKTPSESSANKKTGSEERKNFESGATTKPVLDPERRLYQLAGSGVPISDDLFTEFDSERVLALGRSIAIRRLAIIVANSETPAKDVIPAARLLLTLSGDIKDEGEVIDGERVSAELLTAMSRVKSSE
jgi:hypothetical protein